MRQSRVLEQQIAVFGESGSGKTVMLSAFYGAAQEPAFISESLYYVVADDVGQGSRLHSNYLGMRDSSRRPKTNRFVATKNSFSIMLRNGGAGNGAPFDALRLVWHDYPGQWFEDGTTGEEEAQRRVDTFRTLLGSDVAVVLVDAERLQDNAGSEERYLKSLFGNIRNSILGMADELLADGRPLVEFPRIWLLALSKADLLPDMDVYSFRDLLIEKACDDIDELRNVLAGMVVASEALSVGEDFLLISSAEFNADKIDVRKHFGLDLLLPLAAILPMERHVQWARRYKLPRNVMESLMAGVGPLLAVLLGRFDARRIPFPGPVRPFAPLLAPALAALIKRAAEWFGRVTEEQVRDMNHRARDRHDFLLAALTQFQLDLDEAEKAKVLIRSKA